MRPDSSAAELNSSLTCRSRCFQGAGASKARAGPARGCCGWRRQAPGRPKMRERTCATASAGPARTEAARLSARTGGGAIWRKLLPRSRSGLEPAGLLPGVEPQVPKLAWRWSYCSAFSSLGRARGAMSPVLRFVWRKSAPKENLRTATTCCHSWPPFASMGSRLVGRVVRAGGREERWRPPHAEVCGRRRTCRTAGRAGMVRSMAAAWLGAWRRNSIGCNFHRGRARTLAVRLRDIDRMLLAGIANRGQTSIGAARSPIHVP